MNVVFMDLVQHSELIVVDYHAHTIYNNNCDVIFIINHTRIMYSQLFNLYTW